MTMGRYGHTATLLPSGRVLIAGGVDASDNPVNSAELFDPKENRFLPANGSMTAARAFHTATLLGSGKVLLIGGKSTGGVAPRSAELFTE